MKQSQNQKNKETAGLFFRAVSFEAGGLDEESRELSLTFSSEKAVDVGLFDGFKEVLLHDKKSADFDPVRNRGSILFEHDRKIIIGAVKKVGINANDHVGFVKMVFDKDDDGNKYMGKVKSGSLRGASMGYQIQQAVRVAEGEVYERDGRSFKGPVLVATKWSTHEISLTPAPVDTSVGMKRSLSGIELRNINDEPVNLTEENTMGEEKTVEEKAAEEKAAADKVTADAATKAAEEKAVADKAAADKATADAAGAGTEGEGGEKSAILDYRSVALTAQVVKQEALYTSMFEKGEKPEAIQRALLKVGEGERGTSTDTSSPEKKERSLKDMDSKTVGDSLARLSS